MWNLLFAVACLLAGTALMALLGNGLDHGVYLYICQNQKIIRIQFFVTINITRATPHSHISSDESRNNAKSPRDVTRHDWPSSRRMIRKMQPICEPDCYLYRNQCSFPSHTGNSKSDILARGVPSGERSGEDNPPYIYSILAQSTISCIRSNQ